MSGRWPAIEDHLVKINLYRIHVSLEIIQEATKGEGESVDLLDDTSSIGGIRRSNGRAKGDAE